jgi:hypothetical protein
VLIVDGGSSSTGFTFSGFTGPVSGVTTPSISPSATIQSIAQQARVWEVSTVTMKKFSYSFKAQPAPLSRWFPFMVLLPGRLLETR